MARRRLLKDLTKSVNKSNSSYSITGEMFYELVETVNTLQRKSKIQGLILKSTQEELEKIKNKLKDDE